LCRNFQSLKNILRNQQKRADIVLGIGDDCAIFRPCADFEYLISVDAFLEKVHFPSCTSPEDVGYKALAVSLSDVAAMGGDPIWVTMALVMPQQNEAWLAGFSFAELAEDYNVQLIGGDTTRGPLGVVVQIAGQVPVGRAITRCGANPGDIIYVTGVIGEAGLGLKIINKEVSIEHECSQALLRRLNRPEPRVQLGSALRDVASAAIDISDGLLQDLQHILNKSHVGAIIHVHQIPISIHYQNILDTLGGWQVPLSSGDDYELCFTVSPEHQWKIESLAVKAGCALTRIGKITRERDFVCLSSEGQVLPMTKSGFDHFQTKN